MKTWTDMRGELIQQGVTQPDLLEAARQATAPARHDHRLEVVRTLLAPGEGEEEDDLTGFIASLDIIGHGGPHGAGGPDGRSSRPGPLSAVPGHCAPSGGAWDAAVREFAWESLTLRLDGQTLSIIGDRGTPQESWRLLTLSDGPAPSWWAEYEPWLSALARFIVLDHLGGEGFRGVYVCGELPAASELERRCAIERERRREAAWHPPECQRPVAW